MNPQPRCWHARATLAAAALLFAAIVFPTLALAATRDAQGGGVGAPSVVSIEGGGADAREASGAEPAPEAAAAGASESADSTGFTDDGANDGYASAQALQSVMTYSTITASAGTGGSISPSGAVKVLRNGTITFTIAPTSCYAIAGVIVDGHSVGAVSKYTFVRVRSDHRITASFKVRSYVITATAGVGGTISPRGAVSVDCGGSRTFYVMASTGYHIDAVLVDGVSKGAITSYRFSNVVANHRIAASFARNTYTLTTRVIGSGTIAASPSLTSYPYGTVVTLTASPAAGWHFTSWSGSVSGTANPTTVTMTANRSVTATFQVNASYALNVTVLGNGSVAKSPDLASYPQGSSVQLTATAGAGEAFLGWSGDLSGAANPATLTMNGTKSVTATFTYKLDLSISGSGSVTKSPDQPNYTPGVSVQLTAVPSAGWAFTGWSGDASGSANPTSVTMSADRSVTATFAASNQYPVTVTIVGGGSVGKNPDQSQYVSGSQVALTALADPGFAFLRWSGDASGSTNPLTVTVDGPKNITAVFTCGLSVSVVGGGTVMKNPDQLSYTPGTTVTLTALPDPGRQFMGWSGDASGAANPIPIVLDRNKSVVATFSLNQYTLDVSVTGSGSVTKQPDQALYDDGSIVTLTAVADAGWVFSAWSGDISSTSNPVPVTMDGPKSITATFAVPQFSLITSTTGLGSVAKDPDRPLYDLGTVVKLTATPTAGWHFVNWSRDASGTTNPLNVTMDRDRRVTANFAVNQYTLDVVAAGSGLVSKNPDDPLYDNGVQVVLTPEPSVGWHFVSWSGDATGSDNPLTVTMDANKSITATFASDAMGVTALSGSMGLPITVFALGPVVPNPARGLAHLTFDVPDLARVRLDVMDVAGRVVATLADADFGPGRYAVNWGRDGDRGRLAPGVYLVRMRANGHDFSRRVSLLP